LFLFLTFTNLFRSSFSLLALTALGNALCLLALALSSLQPLLLLGFPALSLQPLCLLAFATFRFSLL
jgi:hypothetical protein